MHIVPGSAKYTQKPNDENAGNYFFEFLLAFDEKDIDESYIEKEIGTSTYEGPGRPFSKTSVSFAGKKNGKNIFRVSQRGGYDI